MKTKEFEQIISEIVGENIKIYLLENQNAKKWYEKTYVRSEEIETEMIYGISLDGGIDYDFKTTKSEDGFLKTFISQYSSKRVEYIRDENGNIVKKTKAQILDSIIENSKNSDRVSFGLFYTTLYGFGLWDFFNSPMVHKILNDSMSTFLKSKGIDYKNEYSDAGWVYRYKFSEPIEKINSLMNEYRKDKN